ncbi:MAG: M23 family metallopeptidase, partial [Bacteroidota bacterium]|nr:M23 family metallopeptidase [Bacteroidota bacterium]
MRISLILAALLLTGTAGYFVHRSATSETDRGGGESLAAREALRYDTATTDWNDYLWPTDAGTTRTSDFAEFRATHFHAGIDVSTGGRTGFNVFAARDGWLHAATFEPGGYGWLLVLRHADGYYTSYAHLDRYSDKVRAAYRATLLKRGRSYGRVEFGRDTIRVKKGEVIAYTGATGAGPAHLHFEVRDPDFNPVNPGLSRHLRPRDSIPPEMKQIMLVPLDASASVQGNFDGRTFNVRGAGDRWRVTGTPVLRGRVGVMLRAHDRANGATDYPTPYRIALYVDGKEVFSSVSNRFQDTLNFHIRIDRDHELMKARKGEFRKLFREEGNLLETYAPRDRDAGVLTAARLGAGERTVMIVAKDVEGNTSVLTMTVMLTAEMGLAHSVDGTRLALKTRGETALLLLEEKSSSGWTVRQQWPGKDANAGVAVDLKMYRGKSIRAVSVDAFGNRVEHATWTPGPRKESAGRLYTRRQILYDQIVYDLKTAVPFGAPPEIVLSQGGRDEKGVVIPISENEYRAVVTAWPGFRGKGRIHVRYHMGETEITWPDSLDATLISAAEGGRLRSADGRFVMDFAPADVHRSMLLTIQRAGGDSMVSYGVGPVGQPLAGRPTVVITATAGMKTPIILPTWPIKKYADLNIPNAAAARVGRYLGSFTLVDDTVGPVVLITIAPRSREPVRISVRDTLSGVDWNSVVVRIGDAIVPFEFDENRMLLVLPRDVFTQSGRGELRVRVLDKAGNETVVRRKL